MAEPSNSDASWIDDETELLSRLRGVDGVSVSRTLPALPGYEHVVELGRGGQGIVCSAVQTSTNRRVAVKLIHSGAALDPRARGRFEREIELAARLRHPSIVRVYDSGIAEGGVPFLIMDLVEGSTLDEHVAAIDPAQRVPGTLGLIRDIALAVHHAHQRGVIHRDLKPSNVRVTPEGTPIVIDFGLAKAFDEATPSGHTLTGVLPQFLGSVAWASPEQARGDADAIDTRTDVYSLGLMLYRALTGESPYNVTGSFTDALSNIENTPPVPLRRRDPKLPRSAERIASCCLAKAPGDRYATAADLAADLDRALKHEPVLAGEVSAWRVAQRQLVRYRVALAVTIALLVGTTAAAVVASSLLSRAHEAERTAGLEADRADAVSSFLTRMLASTAAEDLGREATVRQVLERAESELAADRASGDTTAPAVRQALHEAIATTYRSLGAYAAALAHVDDAITASAAAGSDAVDVLALRNARVGLLIDLSRYDEAEPIAKTLHARAEKELGAEHPVTLGALANVALLLSERGGYDEAIAIHRTLYETRKLVLGPNAEDTITSLHNMAVEENLAGRPERALPHYQEALRIQTKSLGRDNASTLRTRNGYLTTLHNTGDLGAAEVGFVELIPLAERTFGPDHSETNTVRSNYAFLLNDLGRPDEALAVLETAFASSARTLGPAHSTTINFRTGVAVSRYRLGDIDGAIELLDESFRISRSSLGENDARTIAAGKSLAAALRAGDRAPEALPVAKQMLASARGFFAEGSFDVYDITRLLADIQHDTGAYRASIETRQDAIRIAEGLGITQRVITNLASLAESHCALGNGAEADAALAEAMKQAQLEPDPEIRSDTVARLASQTENQNCHGG
ncbi:MAG: serine/threonine-protein kinase [Planctomycetota bacterium]